MKFCCLLKINEGGQGFAAEGGGCFLISDDHVMSQNETKIPLSFSQYTPMQNNKTDWPSTRLINLINKLKKMTKYYKKSGL